MPEGPLIYGILCPSADYVKFILQEVAFSTFIV